MREAGADRGGRNLAGEDEEDDEAESVDDDEASSSAAIAEERVGGEPHVPPAAATPAAPAPAPARSVSARRLDAGQRHEQPPGPRAATGASVVNINSQAFANAAAAAFRLPGVAAPANLANMVATGAIATSLQHEVIGPARRERGQSLYQACVPPYPHLDPRTLEWWRAPPLTHAIRRVRRPTPRCTPPLPRLIPHSSPLRTNSSASYCTGAFSAIALSILRR